MSGTGLGPLPVPPTPAEPYVARSIAQPLVDPPPASLLSASALAPSQKTLQPGIEQLTPCRTADCDQLASLGSPRQALGQRLDATTRLLLDAEEISLMLDAALTEIHRHCEATAPADSCQIAAGQIELRYQESIARALIEQHIAMMAGMGSLSGFDRPGLIADLEAHYLERVGATRAPAIGYQLLGPAGTTESLSLSMPVLSRASGKPLRLTLRWRDGDAEVQLDIDDPANGRSLSLDKDHLNGQASNSLRLEQTADGHHSDLLLARTLDNDAETRARFHASDLLTTGDTQQQFRWKGQADNAGGFLWTQDLPDTADTSTAVRRRVKEVYGADGEADAISWCELQADGNTCSGDYQHLSADGALAQPSDSDYYLSWASLRDINRIFEAGLYVLYDVPPSVKRIAVVSIDAYPEEIVRYCEGDIVTYGFPELYCWSDELGSVSAGILDVTDPNNPSPVAGASLVRIGPP